MNTTASHHTNYNERAFEGMELSSKVGPVTAVSEVHHGRSIAYFLWAYVAIFSSIMALVIIEEAFFIK